MAHSMWCVSGSRFRRVVEGLVGISAGVQVVREERVRRRRRVRPGKNYGAC